jgi:hypothetical protein
MTTPCPECGARAVEIREGAYLCMGKTQHTFRRESDESDQPEEPISIQPRPPSLFARLLHRVLRAVVRRPA